MYFKGKTLEWEGGIHSTEVQRLFRMKTPSLGNNFGFARLSCPILFKPSYLNRDTVVDILKLLVSVEHFLPLPFSCDA
jgi:hypothetical protein